MKTEMSENVELPENTEFSIDNGIVTIKGAKGEVTKNLRNPKIEIKQVDNKIEIVSLRATKREKKNIFTFAAHLRNMIKGVNDGFIYKLKICSGHFPMNVSISGNTISVKNFLGEKTPRTLNFSQDVKVNMNGEEITIEGIDKELVGQTAASFEQLTKVRNRDLRRFQDGIYITFKADKKIK